MTTINNNVKNMKLPLKYTLLSFPERKLVREQYIVIQEGNCYFCKCPLSDHPPPFVTKKKINWRLFPKNFAKYPIHLHHNHETDLTIGAVHSLCNAVLFQYYGE